MNCFLPLARKNAGICAPSLWSLHWPYPRHNTPLVVQKRSSKRIRHNHYLSDIRDSPNILRRMSGSGGIGPLVRREDAQIAWRDALGEPDAVLAAVEQVAITCHRSSIHQQHGGRAMSAADPHRRGEIVAEMHMLAAHLTQTLAQNRVNRRPARAVIEHVWWSCRRELEIDSHAMSLAGADALTRCVEGEALFVVAGDDLLQLRPRDGHAVTRHRREQRLDVDPAA